MQTIDGNEMRLAALALRELAAKRKREADGRKLAGPSFKAARDSLRAEGKRATVLAGKLTAALQST